MDTIFPPLSFHVDFKVGISYLLVLFVVNVVQCCSLETALKLIYICLHVRIHT